MLKAYDPNGKIITKNCYECTDSEKSCLALNHYLRRINGVVTEENSTGGGILSKSVRMMGYSLGTICTLRCKCCCDSIPYIQSRYFVDAENVINDVEKVAAACEFLTFLELIGGEPFLHPKLGKILNHIKKFKNIGNIHIFSNSTVVPSDELCAELQDEKIVIYLSNYSKVMTKNLLAKREETIKKLQSYKVNFLVGTRTTNWKDCSAFDLINTVFETRKTFNDCFFHNCNRIHDGILYVCPHQLAGIQLNKLKELPQETIHIHDYTTEVLALKLEKLKKLPAIDACRYCTMPYKAKNVPYGEQLP